ncbi:RIP metalloprotease RseP [Candidatus Parcubacteria bacterium]|nr:RIP metalloprotease RseP [Candidatus Parcubacteria bacterium]
MVFAILIVVISFVALLILHEFGHFIIAKKFGVDVEEFGIGYPPRLFGKKFRGTLYSLNLIPFGAFVRIKGEQGGIEDARSFSTKPIWQRCLIIIGGVASFWLVAMILLSIVFAMGVSQAIPDDEEAINAKVQIVGIIANSPAEQAGIKIGDTIREFTKVKEVQEFTEKYKGQEVVLTIERMGEVLDVSLTPRVSPPEGEGAMGIALVRTVEKSYPWYLAPIKGVESCISLTGSIIIGLFQVFTGLVTGNGLPPGSQLMGPIGIGSMMTQAVQIGVAYYLQFIALISIYLAIFNILPIPALDGGKLIFLGIEAIRKKPVSQKVEQNITGFFFLLLIFLLIFITFKDIQRLF